MPIKRCDCAETNPAVTSTIYHLSSTCPNCSLVDPCQYPWWRHQIETFSATGPLCGEFTGDRWITPPPLPTPPQPPPHPPPPPPPDTPPTPTPPCAMTRTRFPSQKIPNNRYFFSIRRTFIDRNSYTASHNYYRVGPEALKFLFLKIKKLITNARAIFATGFDHDRPDCINGPRPYYYTS